MSTTTFDKLDYLEGLKGAVIPEAHAHAHAKALVDTLRDAVAGSMLVVFTGVILAAL